MRSKEKEEESVTALSKFITYGNGLLYDRQGLLPAYSA